MLRKIIYYLMWLHTHPSHAQVVTPTYICTLANIPESSGLLIDAQHRIWTLEDSGNPEKITMIDSLGNIQNTLKITNGTNVDWEDMTRDETHTFIGDFGNNKSDRKDLVIYKIPNVDLQLGSKAKAELIHFQYEDQSDFNPPLGKWTYDCEAMTVTNDSIYIFTKDYTIPLKGESRVYRLPKIAGNFKALRVATIKTDNAAYGLGQITAATVSPDQKRAILLANNALYLYSNINLPHFWEASRQQLNFSANLQREAVIFADNCKVLISNESANGEPAQLYELNLCQLTNVSKIIKLPSVNIQKTETGLSINYDLEKSDIPLQVIDIQGHNIFKTKLHTTTGTLQIDNSEFPNAGIYIVIVADEKAKWRIVQKVIFQ